MVHQCESFSTFSFFFFFDSVTLLLCGNPAVSRDCVGFFPAWHSLKWCHLTFGSQQPNSRFYNTIKNQIHAPLFPVSMFACNLSSQLDLSSTKVMHAMLFGSLRVVKTVCADAMPHNNIIWLKKKQDKEIFIVICFLVSSLCMTILENLMYGML